MRQRKRVPSASMTQQLIEQIHQSHLAMLKLHQEPELCTDEYGWTTSASTSVTGTVLI